MVSIKIIRESLSDFVLLFCFKDWELKIDKTSFYFLIFYLIFILLVQQGWLNVWLSNLFVKRDIIPFESDRIHVICIKGFQYISIVWTSFQLFFFSYHSFSLIICFLFFPFLFFDFWLCFSGQTLEMYCARCVCGVCVWIIFIFLILVCFYRDKHDNLQHKCKMIASYKKLRINVETQSMT